MLKCNFILNDQFEPFIINISESLPKKDAFKAQQKAGEPVYSNQIIKDTMDMMLPIYESDSVYQ